MLHSVADVWPYRCTQQFREIWDSYWEQQSQSQLHSNKQFPLGILWLCQWRGDEVYFHFWGLYRRDGGCSEHAVGAVDPTGRHCSVLLTQPVQEPQPPSVGVWQDELSILGTQIKAKQERILLQTQKSLAKERLNNWTISAIISAYFSARSCRASVVLQCG